MDRRSFIKLSILATSWAVLHKYIGIPLAMAETIEKISKGDSEWKKELSPQQYNVLRHEGTEAPFTSPLNNEHHAGTFVCAACGLALFPSRFKFDSGTGWPSFFDVIPGHIETKKDTTLSMVRTEYHCARCGGHQGHVFNDGPEPTGLRYCNNGVALKFLPGKE
jgi:peptide-methionine (R)-S-oxide reductase